MAQESRSGKPIPCDLLVTHGVVLTMDDKRQIYADGAVAITGTRIVAVGPSKDIAPRYKAMKTIDAKGGVVHPGYIDCHTHSSLHLTRGAITDNPRPKGGKLGPGAYNRWTNALTDEDEAISTKMAACEMAKNGFTAFVDAATTFNTDGAAEAVEQVGIRATFGDPYLWDLVGGEPAAAEIPRAPASEERCVKTLGRELKRNKAKDGLTRGHIALYGLGSATEPLLRAAKQEADAAGVVFHQHQNFMAGDRQYDLERFGRDPLLHLAKMGVLGPNVIFTHMNVLSEDECKAVAESGMALVWQPGNYMFYAINKTAPLRMPGLWAEGVPLTFGADVAKVWTYGELGYIAYLLARSEGHYLPSESLVEMFTRCGAQAFGLPNDLGTLAEGRLADVVIRSYDLADHVPSLDPVRHLALVERTKGVDHVIVNGKVVVEDGRLTTVDEDEVFAEARASAHRMAERAQVPFGSSWPIA